MAKFLLEQRNPWNFDLYEPDVVTKILTARLKKDLFGSKKPNFLQKELLKTAVCFMLEKHRLEADTLLENTHLPKEHAAVVRQLTTVISKINPTTVSRQGSPVKGNESSDLEDIFNG